MKTHTSELSGSGQVFACDKCNLMPTAEGHDGCLGVLDESVVMNACCGHGDQSYAYIQRWDGSILRGIDAINEISNLKK